jgi:diguanylate cyclase (GGDEF)-like protein
MRVRGGEEAERLALEAVRDFFSVQWVALYHAEGGAHVCRASRTEDGDQVAALLPGELLEHAVGGVWAPIVCPPELRGRCSPEAQIAAPVELGEGRGGLFLLGPRTTGEGYSTADLMLLHKLVDCCAIALQNAELFDRLRSQVFVDFLTGCYNRRGFEENLKVEVVRARRYRRSLTLVFLDIDHFKWINDGFGHPVGDYALRRVGSALLSTFRTTDRVCRYGGDEFAVIFPETGKDEVLRLAERLRGQVAALFPDAALPSPLSVSLGVASLPDDARDMDELVRAADRALYEAKAGGRNRVAVA